MDEYIGLGRITYSYGLLRRAGELVTENILLELEEELITSELFVQDIRLRGVEFYAEMKSWWRDGYLLLDFLKILFLASRFFWFQYLGFVKPVGNLVLVHELETEVVFFNQIEGNDDFPEKVLALFFSRNV